ncbi:MAG: AEC family transporter [Opitutaceae bacterium]|nr:AEC family transporter [Opitutaceae bacterium]
MKDYGQLLLTIMPVFVLIALGARLRRGGWLSGEAERGLVWFQVNLLYPSLILENVLGSAALREPGNLLWAPLAGFITTAGGMGLSYYAGRLLGLTTGGGLRTFGLSSGIYNYAFVPIPIITSLWGSGSLGVLLVHNVGAEVAVWTLGILLLSGLSLREGWRKLINPTVVCLLLSLALNLSGLDSTVPEFLRKTVGMVAACAIPFGLLLSGTALGSCLDQLRELIHLRTQLGAVALRLGLLPVAFLLLAKYLPCPLELKRVIVVQGAMPSGMISLWLATYYGGHQLTAARVVVATTLAGLITIPLWLSFGLRFVGV